MSEETVGVPLEDLAPSLAGVTIAATEQDESGNTILSLDDGRRLLLVGDYDGGVVAYQFTESRRDI